MAAQRSARLTIRRDGEPPVTQDTPPGVEGALEIPISRGGPTVVEVAVEPLPGEVSGANNRAVVTMVQRLNKKEKETVELWAKENLARCGTI